MLWSYLYAYALVCQTTSKIGVIRYQKPLQNQKPNYQRILSLLTEVSKS